MRSTSRFRLNWLSFFVLAFCVCTMQVAPLFAEKKEHMHHDEGYTINFDNVSIKEFLRFISKIGGVNFVYEEADLDFNVTIISEDETSLQNVMSILVQVLRIHKMVLTEEGDNILIHNNPEIKQIPMVIKEGDMIPSDAALITKVYKIHNGNPSTIAALITPMVSNDAMVEVSMDTRQLIITDTVSSINTISMLLKSLDSPDTPFDVDVYDAQNMPPKELALVGERILAPISHNTLLELIPQPSTGRLYIVSTPFLITRAMAVLKELDQEPIFAKGKQFSADNILSYPLGSKSANAVLSNLNHFLKQAHESGFYSDNLEMIVKEAKYVKATNSLMFLGEKDDLSILHGLLQSIDSNFNPSNTTFFVFEPKTVSLDETMKMIDEIAQHLQATKYAHQSLIHSLQQAQPIVQIHSVLFTGSKETIMEVKELLMSVETAFESEERKQGPIRFLTYNIQQANEEQIRHSLENLATYLEQNEYPNEALIEAIDSMRWIRSTNSLLFTGHTKALKELSEIIPTFDVPPSNSKEPLSQTPLSTDFVMYTPSGMSAEEMKRLVDDSATTFSKAGLADPALIKTLKSARVMPGSNQLIFTGDKATLAKLQPIIENLDHGYKNADGQGGANFALVPIESGDGSFVMKRLHDTADKLEASGSSNPALIHTLRNAEWEPKAGNILLVGTENSISRTKELIKNIEGSGSSGSDVFVYRPQYLSFTELQQSLKGLADHASALNANSASPLIKTIDSMRQMPDSQSAQFVGSPKSIAQLKAILETIDNPDHAKSNVQNAFGSNFLVYKVKNQAPKELLAHLKSIASESLENNKKDSALIRSINTVRYVEGSNSLIFTGNKQDLDKIHTLLMRLDVSSGPMMPRTGRSAEGYKIYNPQYVNGPDLINMVKNFEDHLVVSGVTNNEMGETIDHLSYIPRSNSIIVTGSEGGVEHVVSLLERFDTEAAAAGGSGDGIDKIGGTGFLVHKVQNIGGDSIVTALQQISSDLSKQKSNNKNTNENLIEAIRSVQFISPTNTLIATGDPQVLPSLRALIEDLDRPLKQVFIEVLVLETTKDRDIEFGLNWSSQGSIKNRLGWNTGNYSPNSQSPGINLAKNLSEISGERIPYGADVPSVAGGYVGTIGDLVFHKGQTYATLGSLLNALRTDGDTTVVLSQKIVTQDNQNAKIFSGDNVPFTGSFVTTTGLSQTSNANLEYRNIGVTLSLTPIIGDNDMITLEIDEEISEEANTGDDGSSTNVSITGVNGIRTSKTSMQTKVSIPDRHFLILSGTMRTQVVRSISGIPCLGGLPLIGAAFSETKKQTENRNVIIFVKPHIIKAQETYDKITQQQEELYGRKDQCNQEDFDKAIELMRSADDENMDYDDDFED